MEGYVFDLIAIATRRDGTIPKEFIQPGRDTMVIQTFCRDRWG
jgi:hypothetical protein